MLSKKEPQDRVDPEYLVGLDTASAQPAPTGVRPFIKKHWKPITAAICAAAVAAAVLVPKNSAKPAAASAQYVETRPEKRNIVNSYSADGTITAADTYTVRPMVKGSILTADFEVGDTVSKGDVLYTIDSSDVASSVEKAQLSLDQAQKQLRRRRGCPVHPQLCPWHSLFPEGQGGRRRLCRAGGGRRPG